jgi:hypothetical protein
VYGGSPAAQLPALTALIRQKLNENYRCLYLNSVPMVAGLRSYLYAVGVDVPMEIMKGSLVLASDQRHLTEGRFDPNRMLNMLEEALARALKDGYRGLWATGDMSWEFGPEKDFSKLLDYEWQLEAFFRTHPGLSGICQYHTDTLPREVIQPALQTHQALFLNDTLSWLNPHYIAPGSLTNLDPT